MFPRLFLFLFLFFLPFLSFGRELYVENGVEGGDGSSEFPFGDIQSAFKEAQNGDQITVTPGEYPTKNNTGLELTKNVYDIIIISSKEGVVINFEDELTPFLSTSNDQKSYSATISHFTFLGKKQESVVEFKNGELTLQNCTFGENKGENGHCLAVENADITIVNSSFYSNGWNTNGSAIHSKNSNISITSTTFDSNGAAQDDKKGRFGGSIFLSNSPGKITKTNFDNCYFSKNFGVHGGGVYTENAYVGVRGCEFVENVGNEEGGAICILNSTITIQNSTLEKNNGVNNGGAIHLNLGSLSLTENTKITQNNAYSGGGIYILNGTIDVSGVHEFYENHATYGGAIALASQVEEFNLQKLNSISNSAKYGGAFWAMGLKKLFISEISSSQDQADIGGGIWVEEVEEFEISLSQFSECEAGKGGSIWLKNINSVSLNKLVVQNDKGAEAAIYIGESSGTIYRGTFKDNMGGTFSLLKTGTFIFDEPFFYFDADSNWRQTGIALRSEGLQDKNDIIFIKNYRINLENEEQEDNYYFYGKNTVFVTEHRIPSMELRNSSVTRCMDYATTTKDNRLHLIDGSELFIGGEEITFNKFESSGKAYIYASPDDEDLCVLGPNFQNNLTDFHANLTQKPSPFGEEFPTSYSGHATIKYNETTKELYFNITHNINALRNAQVRGPNGYHFDEEIREFDVIKGEPNNPLIQTFILTEKEEFYLKRGFLSLYLHDEEFSSGPLTGQIISDSDSEKNRAKIYFNNYFEVEGSVISHEIDWENSVWTQNTGVIIYIYDGNLLWAGENGLNLSRSTSIGDPNNHNFALSFSGKNNSLKVQNFVVIYGNLSLSPDSEIKFEYGSVVEDIDQYYLSVQNVEFAGTMSSTWEDLVIGKQKPLMQYNNHINTFNNKKQNFTYSLSPPLSFSLSYTDNYLEQTIFPTEEKEEERKGEKIAAGVGLLLGLVVLVVFVSGWGYFFRKGGCERTVEKV